MAELLPVPPESIPQVWSILEKEIASIVERSIGRLTLESLRDDLTVPDADGGYRKLAWCAVDEKGDLLAICIAGIETHPGGKTFNIYGLSGRDRQRWLPLRTKLEEWARSQGCTHSVLRVRKGYARELSDYRLEHVELVKDLRP